MKKPSPQKIMKYKIVLFCPDRHVVYNLHTLDRKGVGGGITARIRMAHALAGRGHTVTVYVNCPQNEAITGVHYRHFSQFEGSQADVFIASTSGGDIDLGDLAGKDISAAIKILMVHGVGCPGSIDAQPFDHIYAPSNFVRKIAITDWNIDPRRLFVSHHGVVGEYFKPARDRRRNPYSLVYAGHPSKGLDSAIQLLRYLLKCDTRYTLHVFGGSQLWGQAEQPVNAEAGLYYHGLVGQKELALSLQEMGFSINLQDREEPYGMVIDESMRAGCIVLASPVGAYPELVQDGFNGFLISGDHKDAKTIESAAVSIMELMKTPDYMGYVRENATHSPLSWDTIARTWTGHWDSILKKGPSRPVSASQFSSGCPECNGGWLPLADGLHCDKCGNYRRDLPDEGGPGQKTSSRGLS